MTPKNYNLLSQSTLLPFWAENELGANEKKISSNGPSCFLLLAPAVVIHHLHLHKWSMRIFFSKKNICAHERLIERDVAIQRRTRHTGGVQQYALLRLPVFPSERDPWPSSKKNRKRKEARFLHVESLARAAAASKGMFFYSETGGFFFSSPPTAGLRDWWCVNSPAQFCLVRVRRGRGCRMQNEVNARSCVTNAHQSSPWQQIPPSNWN